MKKFAVIVVAGLLAGCNSGDLQGVANSLVPHASARRSTVPIQHIVIIMQENRSFDNFFYDFPGANGATYGYGHGVKYDLQPVDLAFNNDQYHSHWQFLEDYDRGKNDGFDRPIHAFDQTKKICQHEPENQPKCWIYYTGPAYKRNPYSYVYQNQIQPYWDMASQYTLGDNTFSSNNGETFPSHQYMIAGQSGHATEVPHFMPWGCDAPVGAWEYYLSYGTAQPPVFGPKVGHETGYGEGPSPSPGPNPCFPLDYNPSSAYPTIADTLDAAGITWRYYVQPKYIKGKIQDSYWLNAFDAVKAVRYGPDWKTNFSMPDTNVLQDIANKDLQQVSWVMPHGGASDHAGGGTGPCGPNWVSSIVNAIGKSGYWKNTAIIIMWDEWGGWYDHVLPPQYPDPRTGAYEGLGYRVPLIVVSPYAKAHYISHNEHEVASTLHYIEKVFHLPYLGTGTHYKYADRRADAFDDVFDYSQKPIVFQKIKLVPGLACNGPNYFLHHRFPPETDY